VKIKIRPEELFAAIEKLVPAHSELMSSSGAKPPIDKLMDPPQLLPDLTV
jgi:hypothetical protein